MTVVNAPTGNTIAAAEHTLALMYALARHIAGGGCLDAPWRVEAPRSSRASSCAVGRWASSGLGKIGMAIADRARAMEMDVIGHDPFVTAEAAANHGVTLVDQAEVIRRADVLTLHVPLTRSTRNLLDAKAIATMARAPSSSTSLAAGSSMRPRWPTPCAPATWAGPASTSSPPSPRPARPSSRRRTPS